jgi:transitional endoplasmic reticulum ATPase
MDSYYTANDRRLAMLSNCDRNTQRRIRSYASRLLEARNLNPALLTFIICTLKPSAQDRILDAVAKAKGAKNDKNPTYFSAGEISKELLAITSSRKSFLTLDWLIRELSKDLKSGTQNEIPPPATLQQLAGMLALDKVDTDIIMFIYHCETYEPLSDLISFYEAQGFMKLIVDANGLKLPDVIEAMHSRGRLNRTGLIDKTMPKHSPPVMLCDHVIAMINGMMTGYLDDMYYSKDTAPTIPIDRTHVPSVAVSVIRSLLTQPGASNILLYGIPGTGKSEFARSIAAASGMTAYQLKHPEDTESRYTESRRISLMAAANSIDPQKGVLIVDEADSFINTMYSLISSRKGSPDKGWLNTFLDQSKHKIIWITNESRLIEESTMRRFSYSLHFPRPNSRTRYQLWNDLLKDHPMRNHIKDETIRSLSSRYTVTTGGIASALSTLGRVAGIEEQSPDALLTDIVSKHAKAIGVQAGSKMQAIPAAYDASILNTDVSLERIVSSVTKASESAPANAWGGEFGLNLLLWGAPGTGKTAFAQHMAATTGRELLVKRSSDILSPFVGMTEIKIAEAFEEATETGSILLIDEADSLLVDRRYARASWETTQTNELLCQMESYSGMLVCCTNLLDKLDHAVLRRFAWKVEFRDLSPQARLKICARYFPGIRNWEQAEDLASLRGLTPGDVKAVWQRSRTIGDAYATAQEVIDALTDELRYKAPKADGIGFASDPV